MTRRNTTRTAPVQTTSFGSVETTAGVTFSKGNMLVGGAAQVPIQTQQWESSNGLTNYVTVMWQDPATGIRRCSCNCPGWAIKRKNQTRGCKHTKDMMGVSPCDARPVTPQPIVVQNMAEAEKLISNFDRRLLRGIELD